MALINTPIWSMGYHHLVVIIDIQIRDPRVSSSLEFLPQAGFRGHRFPEVSVIMELEHPADLLPVNSLVWYVDEGIPPLSPM